MLFHFTPPGIGFLAPVINNAYVFVGFFFLISGFVLAYNYADRPRLGKRAFYIARLSRVYPVYLLTLLLSIPFLQQEWFAHSRSDFYLGLILTPLSLHGWSPIVATFWNTVGWTLPAEMVLYAVFPFLLIYLRRIEKQLATPQRLAVAIIAMWIVGMLPHMTYLFLNPDHLAEPATRFTYAYWLRALKYTPPMYLCTFTAGVLLARLHTLLHLTEARRTLLAVLSLTGLAAFFAFAVTRVPYVLVHGTLLLPLFAILLLALSGANVVTTVLSWKPLVLFGETTFALYLLHFNGFEMIHLYNLPQHLHVTQFDPWISYLAIMILAFAVHRFYEQPARRLTMSILAKP
jgi:peptidoglycan/LPS O-acetylase OafA/YrhL